MPTKILRLCVLLRLSVLLNRGRSHNAVPDDLTITVKGSRITLATSTQGWLDDAPLTREDLEQEKKFLKEAGFKLKF